MHFLKKILIMGALCIPLTSLADVYIDGQPVTGPQGPSGTNGVNGTNGIDGLNAVIVVGNVETLPAGSPAYVTNTVSSNTNTLTFGIPAGSNGVGTAAVTAVALNGITNMPDMTGVVNLGVVSGGGSVVTNIGVTNYIVLVTDSTKTFAISGTNSTIFNLPSVTVANAGTTYTFVKLSSGILTIQAADSDIIVDSSDGGIIYNNTASETYATITLRLVSETTWIIVGGMGTWVTL